MHIKDMYLLVYFACDFIFYVVLTFHFKTSINPLIRKKNATMVLIHAAVGCFNQNLGVVAESEYVSLNQNRH